MWSSVKQVASVGDFALPAELGDLEVGTQDGVVDAGVAMGGGDSRS